MRIASTLLFLALAACTKAGSTDSVGVTPGAKPGPAPAPAPKTVPGSDATVAITSVTLAGDCGGSPTPPSPSAAQESERRREPSKSERKRAPGSEREDEAQQRICEQTSMQLSIKGAAAGSPLQLRVKTIELFDDKGTRLGELTPRAPTVWSQDGQYRPWDQSVAPATELSVSYVLSAPDWSKIGDRWSHGYVVKAVITVGATDRTVQRDVHLTAPATLPPDVET
jgi:hypothetical protein